MVKFSKKKNYRTSCNFRVFLYFFLVYVNKTRLSNRKYTKNTTLWLGSFLFLLFLNFARLANFLTIRTFFQKKKLCKGLCIYRWISGCNVYVCVQCYTINDYELQSSFVRCTYNSLSYAYR